MNDKQRVARHALRWITDNMIIGLGTGSTADCFIEALAHQYKQENMSIKVVSSSIVSMIKARDLGLPLVSIEQLDHIDIYVDGADEVAPNNTLLKGQGSDLVREKLLATASHQFFALIDQSKQVQYIGQKFPIPIEVMPFAWQMVKYRLEKQGATGNLRQQNNGLAVSSYGSLILDMRFPEQANLQHIEHILNTTPGIVEHGIFSPQADIVVLAAQNGVQEIQKPS